MNNFNKTINGKGLILLTFGMVACLFPALWSWTGQYVDEISFWSVLSVGMLFSLVGLYELVYFKKGDKKSFLIKKGKHYAKQR
jgi:hypothetical protein